MNKYILTFCLVLFFSISFSQNYRIFSPVRKAIFKNNNAQYPGSNSFGALCYNSNMRSYFGMEIETTDFVNGNIILNHFDIIRRDASGTCIYTRKPNWTGKVTVVRSSGENVFVNNTGDSIRIMALANVGNKWHLYDFANENYFEAEVTDKIIGNVLGTNDNIKIIKLTLKDKMGNIVFHNFNDKEIHISENFGILKAYDFSSFPFDISEYTLEGLTSPAIGIQNISAREIFNYEIGDEFHIEYKNKQYPFTSTYKKEKKVVLAKRVYADNDSIEYTYEHTLYTEFKNLQDDAFSYTTKISTTMKEKLAVSDYAFLNPIASKVPAHESDFGNYMPNCLYKTPLYNGKYIKIVSKELSANDDCLDDAFASTSIEHSYIDGLGHYYEGDVSPNENNKRLIYFKKGEETWGNPIDFDILTPTKTRINENLYATLQPNPFSEQSIFKIDNATQQTYKLVVADIQGKLVKEYTFNGDQVVITNDSNLKGLYFYKLYSENNEVGTGKLLIY